MKRLTLIIAVALVAASAGFFSARRWPSEKANAETSESQGKRKKGKKKSTARMIVDSKSPAFDPMATLPYIEGLDDEHLENMGVFAHDATQAQQGYNLYTSRIRAAACLIDMDGRLIHKWSKPGHGAWQHAHALPDGSVLVLIKDQGLFKLDRNSKVEWEYKARVHHDLFVSGRGEIFVLSRREGTHPDLHPTRKVLTDYVTVLSAKGTLLREYSIYDAVKSSDYAYLLPRLPEMFEKGTQKPLDLFHTNHVEVMDGRFSERHPLFAEGNILLSFRQLNAIGVLDPRTESLMWIWGPTNLTAQHHPTVTDDGTLLVFNNGVGQSTVVELNVEKNDVLWTYSDADFFSKTRGSNQRLANGNTLITESDSGYAFEVTPKGDAVWEFANPDVDTKGKRAALWRVRRLEPAYFASPFPEPVSPQQNMACKD